MPKFRNYHDVSVQPDEGEAYTVCPVCSKPFVPAGSQTSCSPECRRRGAYLRRHGQPLTGDWTPGRRVQKERT